MDLTVSIFSLLPTLYYFFIFIIFSYIIIIFYSFILYLYLYTYTNLFNFNLDGMALSFGTVQGRAIMEAFSLTSLIRGVIFKNSRNFRT